MVQHCAAPTRVYKNMPSIAAEFTNQVSGLGWAGSRVKNFVEKGPRLASSALRLRTDSSKVGLGGLSSVRQVRAYTASTTGYI